MPDQSPQRAPHSRHSVELRERAFELHCQFQSNAAIAATLGVPERTVRSWIKAILDETTHHLRQRRVEFLREAICGQRAIAAAAWQAFNLTMDHERARLTATSTASGSPISPQGEPGRGDEDTPAPTTIYRSARLLSVAFTAQREIAHLLRLYDEKVVPPVPVEILITRNPPWPEPDPSDYIPGGESDPYNHPDDGNPDDHPDDPWNRRSHDDPPFPSRPSAPASIPPSPLQPAHDDLAPTTSPDAATHVADPLSCGRGVARQRRGEVHASVGGSAPIKIENPATPATATPALTSELPAEIPESAPTAATSPSEPTPERPPYPIAWLFPPGSPIPRPYRNAAPRPDHAFTNGGLRL